MTEQNIRMVTIPLDEYMDLARASEMNTFFIDRISGFQSQVDRLMDRVYQLENEVIRIREREL